MPSAGRSRRARFLWILAVIPAAVLLVMLFGGKSQTPPPGKLYDVGGFKLHINCTGPEASGLPTVIIESANSAPSIAYAIIQERVAQTTRVCSSDHAGMGWSEESGGSHDGATLMQQLHVLLGKAGVKPPYVFAGHSSGGLMQTVYTKLYPDEVVGLVYIDSSHPEQFARLPDSINEMVRQGPRTYKILGWMARLGVTNLLNPLDNPGRAHMMRDLPPAAATAYAERSERSNNLFAAAAEFDQFDTTAKQAGELKSFGDRPVAVLGANSAKGMPAEIKADYVKARVAMTEMHHQYASMSSRGRYVEVEGADHGTIAIEKPYADQVATEIVRVVREASGK